LENFYIPMNNLWMDSYLLAQAGSCPGLHLQEPDSPAEKFNWQEMIKSLTVPGCLLPILLSLLSVPHPTMLR